MRYIFLISGYMGSGKDYLADYMVSTKKFKKYASANVLKDIVGKKYNLDKNLLNSQIGKCTIVTQPGKPQETIRDLLIKEANNIKQLIGQDVFIKDVIDNILIDDYVDGVKNKSVIHAVISDFRYIHEYTSVNQRFSELNVTHPYTKIITIRINRFDKPPQNIESETNLDNFSFTHVIDNKSTVVNFKRKIAEILNFYEI
jgi:dephospho-CoA kinase